MGRPSCKDLILDSAEAVVRQEGGARLTLDAVAEKAGVSKGGVLYHFPSKEALVEAMLSRQLERNLERQATTLASLPECCARPMKAEILSLLVMREKDDKIASAILAAVANEPRLMCSIQEFHRKRFEAHDPDQPGWERRALTLLAADGLFFLELLQVSPFSPEQRDALVTEMLRMAEEVATSEPTANTHTS